MKIKNIALIAILSALFVLLSFFSISLPNMKITLQNIIIYIAGMIFSPHLAAFTGGLGSFISQILLYGLMPTTFIWILPHIIVAFIFSYLYKIGNYNKTNLFQKSFFVLILVSNFLLTILNTLVLFLDSKINGYYTFATVFGSFIIRMITCIVTSIIYFLIIPILYKNIFANINISEDIK